MADVSTLLALEGVSKWYDAVAGSEAVRVLERVDLEVGAGESVAVVGPSGSGKSTLLNIMGTLDRPSEGKVMLGGQDLSELDDKALARLRNRRIGFVFQLHHLLGQCTVLENVLVPTLAQGKDGNNREARERGEALLERVGLKERMGYRPGQLSGGERQRVAVVRALINRPTLVLADEPTGSLDRHGAEQLGELLAELNTQEEVSLVVVTHSLGLAKRMGKVLELRDGNVRALSQD